MLHGVLLLIQSVRQGVLNIIGLDFHVLVELCYVQDWSLGLGLDPDHAQQNVNLQVAVGVG